MERIILHEHESAAVKLSRTDAQRLASAFRNQVQIWPSGTTNEYVVRPGPFVGTIRLADSVLVIKSKVPVSNLFWMLSYAHDLADFRDLDVGLRESDDIFEFIVRIFAEKVSDLARQGLGRGYVEQEENLPTVRGRVAIMPHLRSNYAVKSRVLCRYVEHTEDIVENQILKLCCYLLTREPLQDGSTRMVLRGALGRFENVTLKHVRDADMDSVFFSRLNQRYAGCITLARLLLSRMSVFEESGAVPVNSFLIDMNRLFERFVAAALRKYVEAAGASLALQYSVHITEGPNPIYGLADMVVRRTDSSTVVLDTKYKEPGHKGWNISDVYQVATYCSSLPSGLGILIYASSHRWQWARRLVTSGATIAAASIPLASERQLILDRINRIGEWATGQQSRPFEGMD